LKIVSVLRSGGDYMPRHAQALAAQIAEHAWPCKLEVLTDMDVPGVATIPLRHDWPGWWSKMELFALEEDFLYFDLDTVIVGGLEAITAVNRLTVLRDPYWMRRQDPKRIGSGMMFVPAEAQLEVWKQWLRVQNCHLHGGDQAFLKTLWIDTAARWQDTMPGQTVSYKVDVRGKKIPDGARVVYFHGEPRPWFTSEFSHLYKEAA
jgi:hypothetical protein